VSALIAVRHNIEVAHRLFENKGKCEQIHGHSMSVTVRLGGEINNKGFMDGIEFGALKKDFRTLLDEQYDHRLLLNASDPFARPIYTIEQAVRNEAAQATYVLDENQIFLPGLQAVPGDPTTENIAKWIYKAMYGMGYPVWEVEVWETAVNMATYLGGE
jgi:6-pyruvoyltetrahydropterin/6-carboxytetrahydropterin synthase